MTKLARNGRNGKSPSRFRGYEGDCRLSDAHVDAGDDTSSWSTFPWVSYGDEAEGLETRQQIIGILQVDGKRKRATWPDSTGVCLLMMPEIDRFTVFQWDLCLTGFTNESEEG